MTKLPYGSEHCVFMMEKRIGELVKEISGGMQKKTDGRAISIHIAVTTLHTGHR